MSEGAEPTELPDEQVVAQNQELFLKDAELSGQVTIAKAARVRANNAIEGVIHDSITSPVGEVPVVGAVKDVVDDIRLAHLTDESNGIGSPESDLAKNQADTKAFFDEHGVQLQDIAQGEMDYVERGKHSL